jgi:predicted ATPase
LLVLDGFEHLLAATGLTARQRSMRAVFGHSWYLLTEQEQQVLGALSVLRGSFDEGAAGQAAGALLRELRSLVDKSMLHQASRGRYQRATRGRSPMHSCR